MGFGERLADETAHHYAELRDRRVPRLPAVLMALWFHRLLCRAVIFDDHFERVAGEMLSPRIGEGEG